MIKEEHMKRILVILVVFLLMFFAGCVGAENGKPAKDTRAQEDHVKQPQVSIFITTHFGTKVIADKSLPLKSGASVMDVLGEHFDIETAYGGGFVNGINGIRSNYTKKLGNESPKMDWFYYVNGVQASVGCLEYFPRPGDIIWWDYHDWDNAMFIPAVTGCYPEPFLHGYEHKTKGTLIMYQQGYEAIAEKIAANLEVLGAKNIELKNFDPGKILNRDMPTMVVGVWDHIGQDANIQKIMENKRKTGIYLDLSTSEFTALNPEREKVQSFTEHPGAIFATGTGSGDGAPLWIVTGMDNTGLHSAVEVLTEERSKIKGSFAVIIEGDQVINVPAVQPVVQ